MKYQFIFFPILLLSFFSSEGASKSQRGLQDFESEYGLHPHLTAFKRTSTFSEIMARRPSRHETASALESALTTYAECAGGLLGAEAAATETEVSRMKTNAFEGIRKALNDWESYLAPIEGVEIPLWTANPGNTRPIISQMIDTILALVPAGDGGPERLIRTGLTTLKLDLTSAERDTYIQNDSFNWDPIIKSRIDTIKMHLPDAADFVGLTTHSTSRDLYEKISEVLPPPTFSIVDLKASITFIQKRINWLTEQNLLLIDKIKDLKLNPIVSIQQDKVTALATKGVTITSPGSANTIIQTLINKILSPQGLQHA